MTDIDKEKMRKLKQCPFCGEMPEKIFIGNEYTKRRSIEIKCPKCRIKRVDSAIIHSHEWLDAVATQSWNQRTKATT